MSYAMYVKAFKEESYKSVEVKKLIGEIGILYDDDKKEMARGYEEMASLNLEYAEMGNSNLEVNDYVDWLSGE